LVVYPHDVPTFKKHPGWRRISEPSTIFFPKAADPKQLYLRESRSQDFFSAKFRVKKKTSVKRISSLRFFLSSLMQHVKEPSTGAQFTTTNSAPSKPQHLMGQTMYETDYMKPTQTMHHYIYI